MGIILVQRIGLKFRGKLEMLAIPVFVNGGGNSLLIGSFASMKGGGCM